MASTKPPGTKASAKASGAPPRPAPLIPEHTRYSYKPAQTNRHLQAILTRAHAEKVKIDVPKTPYATLKLVHTLCSAAKEKVWSQDCETALVESLPLREHHKAFLSHNMFVTMIGTVVARALEQATRDCVETLDLLIDRYYVRSIACHDSSKTSVLEAAAYSGIMAVHLEKEALAVNRQKRHKLNKRYGSKQTDDDDVESCSLDSLYTNSESLMTAMANLGFKHHYEKNPHHPEHFPAGQMDDMNLIEAIVDGLACLFERNKNHKDAHSWLDMYNVDRFKGRNRWLAHTIIVALKMHITNVDYKALEGFRSAIFAILGESIPWSCVSMTECCTPATTQDCVIDFTSCFLPMPKTST